MNLLKRKTFFMVLLAILTKHEPGTVNAQISYRYASRIDKDSRPKMIPMNWEVAYSRVTTKIDCAISCIRDEFCISFTVAANACELFDEQYPVESRMKALGYSYYTFKNTPTEEPLKELRLLKNMTPYDAAKDDCNDDFWGHLATIQDQETQDLAKEAIIESGYTVPVWLGLHGTVPKRLRYESQLNWGKRWNLRWVNGEDFDYAFHFHVFKKGPYTDDPVVCIAMDGGKNGSPGEWIALSCEEQNHYLCEINI